MSETTDALNQIQNAFTELKSTNEANLKQRDVVLEEKLANINASMTAMEQKLARPNIKSDVEQATDEHKSAWNRWSRKGVGEHELETLEKKAMIVGDANSAGVALPKLVETQIYESLVALSPIRENATVVSVSSADYRILVDNKDLGAGWVGETDARPETKAPTLSELKVPFGEVYANPFVSQQALDDLAFDVEAFIANATAVKFAQMENAAFVAGDGVNKPKGFMTAALPTIKTGAAAAMPSNADYIFTMIQTLPAAYRNGAKFYTASATTAGIRTLKDSTGNYLYSPISAAAPAGLGGFELVAVEEMDAVAAGKLPLVFANLKQGYVIADRVGIRTLRDPYSNKPFVGFYSTKRVGGMVRDAQAFVALKVAA